MSDQFGLNITYDANGNPIINGNPVGVQSTANTPAASDTSVNPDGPKVTTNDDGSVTTKNADGSSKTTYGDKSTTVVNPDGSKTITTADGTVTTVPGPLPAAVLQNDKNASTPTLNPGTAATAVNQVSGGVKSGEILDQSRALARPATTGQTTTANSIAPKDAATYNADTTGQAAESTGAQGAVSPQAQVEAQQQAGLSPELKAEFDTFKSELSAIGVDPNMTVAGQYEKLMNFGPDDIPPWAQGAYRVAQQEMAKRGIQGSTIAGEAITTSLMQAAMPIAQQDAKVFETLKLTKLDKMAQATFLRAGYIANLDMANLNNRQQAAVINAQSFLAMDMKNLDNVQQSNVITTQNRQQKMLSDQASVNAARQFNATSTNQVNQFYDDLGGRISMFNAAQANGMEQFNANAINDRDKFNVSNLVQIDQSNATYLRGINTQNTAVANQVNMVNSQNLLGISNQAMANQIQMLRDSVAYNFQAGENALDRAQQQALLGMQNQEWFKRMDATQQNSLWSSVGGAVANVVGDVTSKWVSNIGNTSNSGWNTGGATYNV